MENVDDGRLYDDYDTEENDDGENKTMEQLKRDDD